MLKSGLVGIFAAACFTTLSAQTASPPPPNGTMALEGTMKTFYKGLNAIIVTTMDGVEHTYEFSKRLIVHGGKSPGPDALVGLNEGRMVVIHYTVQGTKQSAEEIDVLGDEGLKVTEGRVVRIDRGHKEITIRFDNGRTETLRLTDLAAAEAGKDIDKAAAGGGERVVVYYEDENGRKVAHYFKKVSEGPPQGK